jgi:hypothetical protein
MCDNVFVVLKYAHQGVECGAIKGSTRRGKYPAAGIALNNAPSPILPHVVEHLLRLARSTEAMVYALEAQAPMPTVSG